MRRTGYEQQIILQGVIVVSRKKAYKIVLTSNNRSLLEYQTSALTHWPRNHSLNTARLRLDISCFLGLIFSYISSLSVGE